MIQAPKKIKSLNTGLSFVEKISAGRYLQRMRDLDLDLDSDATLPGIDEGEIVVVRSNRRKKNISAYRAGGRIVVSIPARMSKSDERAMIPEMVAKIRAQEAASTMSESGLAQRIDELLRELASKAPRSTPLTMFSSTRRYIWR